ncbi:MULTISPECIES: transporter substrate-binding domain-containing protein [Atopobiaceae]|uniref:transporter substrate-binding domain-containing protein n=1 Tax=Atopobiaceae TaxID=1643824 RepID=UPI00034E4874|nr:MULTISPECIES: transporter substrate-binding domain-containing protein [Atopobiaceae]EPD78271.1 polar amino acid transport system substrate-binding protein [Atopobium sp. oral taxon 199 str. F0494]
MKSISVQLTRRAFLGIVESSAALVLSACDHGGSQTAGGGAAAKASDRFRSVDDIKTSGAVNIGYFSDKAPFGYVDKDGNPAGYDVVFGNRLAQDLGVEARYVSTDGLNRVPFLQSNKVDIMLANFTVTDERAEKVDFSLPYMKIKLGIVSPEAAVIRSVDELEGKKLIVSKGTTAETYFEKQHPNVQLVKFDSYADAYNALLDGRGDAFSTDNTEVLAWVKSNPGFVVGVDDLGNADTIAAAVHKGNTTLLEFINNEITGPLAEESFFHKDYEETLRPVYGDDVDPETIVVEGGKV